MLKLMSYLGILCSRVSNTNPRLTTRFLKCFQSHLPRRFLLGFSLKSNLVVLLQLLLQKTSIFYLLFFLTQLQ